VGVTEIDGDDHQPGVREVVAPLAMHLVRVLRMTIPTPWT